MVTSTTSVQSANAVTDFTLSGTNSQSVDSFAQQLLTAIDGYLGQSGNGSQLQINIQSAGQNSAGSSQFVVTVQDEPAAQSAGTTSTPTASIPTTSDLAGASVTPAAEIVSQPAPNETPAVGFEASNQGVVPQIQTQTSAALFGYTPAEIAEISDPTNPLSNSLPSDFVAGLGYSLENTAATNDTFVTYSELYGSSSGTQPTST
jgi:hypothetical protein